MSRIKGAADGSARKRVLFVLMPMMTSLIGQNRLFSVAFFYLLYQIFWGSVKFQAVHLIVLRNFHSVCAHFHSSVHSMETQGTQLWSVLGPKFLTWWLVLGWVNVCYLLQSWGKLSDYLMLLVHHSFVVPVIGMPALSSKVLSVCFLHYISRSSHFWVL
jgi:hypothetical protein